MKNENLYKTFKTRIYPNEEQKRYLNECFGYYRFVYNWGLNKWFNENECNFNKFDYIKEYNHSVENDVFYDWVNRYNKSIKQEAFGDLEVAIKTHFIMLKNKTVYRHNLKFRSKRFTNKYFRMHSKRYDQFYLNNKFISIHTCNFMKYSNEYSFKRLEFNMKENPTKKIGLYSQDIKQIAISQRNNKYYIHLIYIVEPIKNYKFKKSKIGIDLGYKNPLVSYNGSKIKSNYKFPIDRIKYYENRIDNLNKKLSKQMYGSNRFYKTKTKLNELYLKIYNIRKDWREKVTTKLIKKYRIINIDIPKFQLTNIKSINRSILRVGINDFINRLYSKSLIYGNKIIEMPKKYKSTQICSCCGNILKGKNKLSINNRVYKCPICNSKIDRDINASINIYNFKRIKISKLKKKQNKKNKRRKIFIKRVS